MNHSITRRCVLKTAAALGACQFVPARALGKAGSVAPSKRITLAVIGLGIQGTGDMRAFLGMSEIQVVAVCDVHEGQRAQGKQVWTLGMATRTARSTKTSESW